jgi:4-amino-4-deoxy-L-arabinose transferase-like glycosyltransferase
MGEVTASLSRIRRPFALLERLSVPGRTIWQMMPIFVVFAMAFGAVAWRNDTAPDVFTDEILYTRLATRVAEEGALVWDSGRPIFVHPPLYFLAEGAFLALTADTGTSLYTAGDIFAQVYHTRTFNAVLAGLTAVVLYVLGVRLRGAGLGILFVALFLLDPFAVRTNRRAMIETMAALLTLSGLVVLLTGKEDDRRPLVRGIGAGLLLGAGLLTKDLMIFTIVAVFIFGYWELWRRFPTARRQDARALAAPFMAVGIAVLSYALVPAWALTTGYWDRFVSVKSLALQRLIGLVHTSGWNRPGVSLVELVAQRLDTYGSSYLILALGGVAAVVVLLLARRERAGRLLAVWGLVLYPIFAFVAVFGSGNDQFFYYLLLPAIILIGYAITLLLERWPCSKSTRTNWVAAVKAVTFALLVITLAFNAFLWWRDYAISVDDGYRQLAAYVRARVPPGEPINASGDVVKFRYFFPDHPITAAASPVDVREHAVRYFVLAPKDVKARYGRITPELSEWITSQGELRFATTGDSYGDIFFYFVDTSGAPLPGVESGSDVVSFPKAFAPAETGFLTPFVVGLALWTSLWVALALWLVLRPPLRFYFGRKMYRFVQISRQRWRL